jgi:hypothetical protein
MRGTKTRGERGNFSLNMHPAYDPAGGGCEWELTAGLDDLPVTFVIRVTEGLTGASIG